LCNKQAYGQRGKEKKKKHPKVGKATISNLALNNRYLKFDQQSDIRLLPPFQINVAALVKFGLDKIRMYLDAFQFVDSLILDKSSEYKAKISYHTEIEQQNIYNLI
jgi:hypothetical protein